MAELDTTALIDVPFFSLMLDECITEGTEDEDRAINTINFVSFMFDSFCNRRLVARDYTYNSESDDYDQDYSIFDGPKGQYFWFPTYPVNSITTFIISDITITPATSYNATDGYFLYNKQGKLYYYGGFDYGYPQNIQIAWNGGYTSSAPEMTELKQLCFEVCKNIYRRLGETSATLKSETIGTYSYQNFSPMELDKYKSMHPMVFQILSKKYRREVFA